MTEEKTMEWEQSEHGMALVSRLETAAGSLERTLAGLEEKQLLLSGEVERISATVETSHREEELLAKLTQTERELANLKAAAVAAPGFPKALEPLRRTLPTAAVDMLAKHRVGDEAIDVRVLDAALAGFSVEQRIAVKSQLRRAGAIA
jgi:hypothetical protein